MANASIGATADDRRLCFSDPSRPCSDDACAPGASERNPRRNLCSLRPATPLVRTGKAPASRTLHLQDSSGTARGGIETIAGGENMQANIERRHRRLRPRAGHVGSSDVAAIHHVDGPRSDDTETVAGPYDGGVLIDA